MSEYNVISLILSVLIFDCYKLNIAPLPHYKFETNDGKS